MHNLNLTWSGDNAKREGDSVKPKDGLDTRLCQVDFIQLPSENGARESETRNIPLDTAFSDDRQLKTESADSSLGLSNGRGGSRDINPAFDSEGQDEVITLGPGLQGIDGSSHG